MQRNRPGLVADHSVGGHAAPGLKRLHGSLGTRAEIPVDSLRAAPPRAGRAVGEKLLQGADDVPGGALAEKRHRTTVGQGIPGERADDPSDDEDRTLLEIAHGSLEVGPEYAVNRQGEVRRAAHSALQALDHIAGGARSDGRLTRIRHHRLLVGDRASLWRAGAKRSAGGKPRPASNTGSPDRGDRARSMRRWPTPDGRLSSARRRTARRTLRRAPEGRSRLGRSSGTESSCDLCDAPARVIRAVSIEIAITHSLPRK